MDLLKKGENPKDITFITTCGCGTKFKYNNKEIISDQRDGDYIICPLCKSGIIHKEENKVIKKPIWSPALSTLPPKLFIDGISENDKEHFREMYFGNFKPIKDVPFIVSCYDPTSPNEKDYSVMQITHRGENGKVFHLGEYRTQDRKDFKEVVDNLKKFFTPLNSKWLTEK
ncbi:MAG: hypothetical protein CL596_05260 [Alteromonas sp.]|nr:hypothetical protein [Alteromonas sp.]|tara:strand:- start:6508 stop:7020 length:513 start_codon:yes stop_codon:yes gene_type:complete